MGYLHNPNPFEIKDWPWFWIAIFLAAAAPLGGSVIAFGVELLSRKKHAKLQWTAPYRDGQLGYIVVGWCAAALLEVHQMIESLDFVRQQDVMSVSDYDFYTRYIHGWQDQSYVACCLIAALGALVAALGAANPVPETPDPLEPWYKTYLSAVVSIWLTLVGFYVVNRIHANIIHFVL